MFLSFSRLAQYVLATVAAVVTFCAIGLGEEPPALNPFGPKPTVRRDAQPGYVELSDGQIVCGRVYLTRDMRLKIHDEKSNRQREIPLRVIRQIDCEVKREWMEKEWRFEELAKDEKVYTGKKYPAREYLHTITLADGRKLKGPLAALVYLEPVDDTPAAADGSGPRVEPRRLLLHKRDKGNVGADLKSLVYVRCIKLGQEALKKGRQKQDRQKQKRKSPAPKRRGR